MKIKKEIYPEILSDTYFFNFDSDYCSNYYFVNFESIDDIRMFIKKEGILKLYNNWLDFIGNCCYICEDEKEAEECCVLAKVVNVGEKEVEIEQIPFSIMKNKTVYGDFLKKRWFQKI